MLRYAPNLDTIDIDVIYSVPFRPQKRFLNPQLKISFLGHFSTLNFRKKFFLVWKNQRLNRFIDLKISFFITSLHVLSTPNTICPKPWDYRYRGHIFGTFSPPKAIFEPTTRNIIFGSFLDPKFSKKNFFLVWKNQRLNRFIDLKIWFFITSLHVLSTPNTICPYLKKIFWSKNIWYFGLRKG